MPIPKGKLRATRVVLADVLYDRLLAEIVSGARRPESSLSEHVVAEQNGVSRTPVREALDRLTAIGLATMLPGRGSIVAPLDARWRDEVLETLGAVLAAAVRLVVEIADDRERRTLEVRLDQRGGVSAPDLFRPDGPFEQLLVVLANPRILRAWHELVPHVRRAWNLEPEHAPEPLGDGASQSLVTALRSRDQDVAAEVIASWFDAALPSFDDTKPIGSDALSVERATLREHALESIYRAIADGTLEPGEDLNEDELAEWLEVSRQPVRQALLRLADTGLVTLSPGRSAKVSALDPAWSNAVLMYSSMLNEYALGRVGDELTPAQRIRLDDVTGRMAAALESGDQPAFGQSTTDFMTTFTSALGNRVIDAQVRRIDLELGRLFTPGSALIDPTAMPGRFGAINDAVQSGDLALARRLVHELYEPNRRNFREDFRRP